MKKETCVSLVVTLEAKSKPEFTDKVKSILRETILETRAFDGCLAIEIHENVNEKGQFMFHEKWESKSKYDAYFSWRSASEAMKTIGPMLVDRPKITYYESLDI
jgi:quinol monooxygenase YgiN